MKEMDIVIVSYAKNKKCWDLTYECINSLFSSEEEINFNVFVVESQKDVNWSEIFKRTKTIYPETSYGYHKYLNLGRKEGNADFVALCNNDLIFKKKWASKIFESSNYNPNYFSFSPICPKTQPLYGIQINSGLIKGYIIRKHISGWCIVQKRSIYNTIGDLDENFVHWFADEDYAQTLIVNNINHMLVTTSIVEHHSNNLGKTTTELITDPDELYRLTTGAKKIFDNKWNKNEKL